ncbi:HalOD1 output domain-containing protein [Salinigranum marinum]|uniref:HalOD1 output domain-containing protein n=1 Tax=Salinigranum marinum TaxID=1515595 RepID=UPI002989B354|nr:HalOD1 output domain-containing protein [Salinigranum marinum]
MDTRATLLHVDPDDDCLGASRSSFEGTPGVRLLTRADGEAALATLSVEAVDVVVTDAIDLPDGTPLAEAIRNRYPSVPVVLYTNEPFADVAPLVARAGITEYARKDDGRVRDAADHVRRLVDAADSTPARTPRVATTFDAPADDPADESPPVDSDEWTELTRCDPTSTSDLVVTLADALGDRADDRPLGEEIDPEALAALFESANAATDLHVRFRLGRHEVVVTADGVVKSRPISRV